MRVLVAEPSAPISAALRKFLTGTAEVQLAHYLDEATQIVRAAAPDVVIASVSGQFDGEVLAQLVRKQAPNVGVILVYPPEEEGAAERSQQAGADSFLVGPLKKAGVLAAVRTVMAIRVLRTRVSELEADAQRASTVPGTVPAASAPRRPSTQANVVDDSFFKNFLLLEVKRSKRYQYPLALMIVALDQVVEFLENASAPRVRREAIRNEVIMSIGACIRDIDVAYPFADNRYLVFLAHTPRDGARIVASRIQVRLNQLQAYPAAKCSIGVAVYDPKADPKASVSFGSLVKDATAALQKVIAAGGNGVDGAEPGPIVKKSRISIG